MEDISTRAAKYECHSTMTLETEDNKMVAKQNIGPVYLRLGKAGEEDLQKMQKKSGVLEKLDKLNLLERYCYYWLWSNLTLGFEISNCLIKNIPSKCFYS